MADLAIESTGPAPLDERRPFTRADAIAAGISPGLLRGSRFRRIFRNVYIDASVPDHPLVRVQAALLTHPPGAFASHASAGRVYGVPLPALPDEHVSVFTAKDRRRRAGIRNHLAPAGQQTVTVRGLSVSTPEDMFVELSDVLTLVDLVVVGDALVRLKLTTPEALVERCATANAAARRAAALVRRKVDSAMETRLRLLIVFAGLPEPEINVKIYYRDGRVRYRFDLSYPEFKILVEYDGRQHRDDLDQWDADTRRQDWFDHNGWMRVPVFSRGIYRRPDETIQRVAAALRSRGAKVPDRLSEEWRAHFPVRP